MRAGSHQQAGPDLRAVLAAPGSITLSMRMLNANAIPLSSLWRTEIFRGHGAAQRSVRTKLHEYDDDAIETLGPLNESA